MELATLPLLADIADLADRRGVAPDDEDYQALQALAQASAFFRSYTGQEITVTEDDEQEIRGTWDDDLVLPQKPVTSVTDITIRYPGETTQTVDPVWDDFLPTRRGLLRRHGGWGGPSAIVFVTYTHGFEIIPDDVRHCVLGMAERAYIVAAQASSGAAGPVVRKSIGSFEVQYGESSSSTATTTTAAGVTADEQFVLDKYAAW